MNPVIGEVARSFCFPSGLSDGSDVPAIKGGREWLASTCFCQARISFVVLQLHGTVSFSFASTSYFIAVAVVWSRYTCVEAVLNP